MAFGERLQALRHANGMTQEEFAQQLKVSRQAVSKWESCRGYPEIEKIIWICNRYHVSMDDLFMDEVPPIPSETAGEEKEKPAALGSTSIKKSFSNFVANLSPASQSLVAVGVAFVLVIVLTLLLVSISKGESNGMDPLIYKLVWAGLLVLFGIGEALTVGLTSVWFMVGSLGALIVALLGGQLWLQVAVFIVITVLCLLAMRPLAQKHLNSKVEPTNADRIIGSDAYVTEEIDNLRGTGAVRVGGIVWSARSESDEPVPAGTLVRVLRIEGVKVYVEKVKEEVK